MPLRTIPVARAAPAWPAAHVPTPPPGERLTLDCWSCDTPNTPSRMFCVSCGSFIAVGSSRAVAGTVPASGGSVPRSHPNLLSSAESYPGAPLEEAPAPFVEGAMALGPYATAARRRAARRARTLTAATSVALALVVGVAALYVAAPWDDRSGERQTAAVDGEATATGSLASARPAAATAASGPAGGETRTLSGAAVPPAGTAADAGPDAPPAEADPLTAADLSTTPDGVSPVQAGPDESGASSDQGATGDASDGLDTDPPADSFSDVGGWVCDGPLRLDDSRARGWSLGRVTFRARPGFERVILHLERAGPRSGEPASVTARALPTARLDSLLPGVRRPSLGRSTIGLRLAGGIDANLGLRGYRPSGLAAIREFSVYPAPAGESDVLISTSSGGCFRLRVPAWSDPSSSVRRAEVLVDVKS